MEEEKSESVKCGSVEGDQIPAIGNSRRVRGDSTSASLKSRLPTLTATYTSTLHYTILTTL